MAITTRPSGRMAAHIIPLFSRSRPTLHSKSDVLFKCLSPYTVLTKFRPLKTVVIDSTKMKDQYTTSAVIISIRGLYTS